MSSLIKIFRWGDVLVGTLLLCGVAFSIPILTDARPQVIDVFKDNQIIATFPLNLNHEYQVSGFHDTMTIGIKDYSVSITNVACPHKLCMQSGKISLQGQQIVCAPNHVLIRISGSKKGDDIPDGIAR